MPFAKRVHCQGWAQRCYLLSAVTIAAHLSQRPLHPLIALGHFLAEQKMCIIDMTTKNGPTIKALYGIAKRVFEDETALEDARQDATSAIYNKAI
ncbi:hypothetical protein BJV82DRAFT_544858 [Fennellomyces sp. T-0311]|nr:hypothetical protein BJV82DRAFT_544858 [Fennellomyces sp. T-0311]